MDNQAIIDQFFKYYMNRNIDELKNVMSEEVSWTFLGRHKLAGIKKGITEVVAFFDIMTGIMAKSNPTVEKLIFGTNENYIIECQHIKTNRADGINIDHQVCVLWTFANGKIISGKHFFADPIAADRFFDAV